MTYMCIKDKNQTFPVTFKKLVDRSVRRSEGGHFSIKVEVNISYHQMMKEFLNCRFRSIGKKKLKPFTSPISYRIILESSKIMTSSKYTFLKRNVWYFPYFSSIEYRNDVLVCWSQIHLYQSGLFCLI